MQCKIVKGKIKTNQNRVAFCLRRRMKSKERITSITVFIIITQLLILLPCIESKKLKERTYVNESSSAYVLLTLANTTTPDATSIEEEVSTFLNVTVGNVTVLSVTSTSCQMVICDGDIASFLNSITNQNKTSPNPWEGTELQNSKVAGVVWHTPCSVVDNNVTDSVPTSWTTLFSKTHVVLTTVNSVISNAYVYMASNPTVIVHINHSNRTMNPSLLMSIFIVMFVHFLLSHCINKRHS